MLNANFLLEEAVPSGLGSQIWLYVILIGAMVVFMVFNARKQKKQEKEINTMRDSLQIGDEVTTIGGVIGKVVSIKGETVTIETAKARTQIRFLRSAIRSVDVRAEDAQN
ncbi:MAG: preprotein translocase subunit YajC [Eubacteriales bacterium]